MSRLTDSPRAAGALAALSLGAFVYVTVETLPVGLLLPIATDLRTTPSAVGMLVTFYGLVVVLTSIPLTRLTYRIPRRRLMTVLLTVFVLATVASATAHGYRTLLLARVVTALSQALFWAIVVPTAAGLFPPHLRARAIGVVFAGSSLAAVVGIPAGTWLGQQAGWRPAFLASAGIGAIVLTGVATLLPGGAPTEGIGERAPEANPRAYWSLMATLALAVTGSFALFTYVTPFLADVAHLPVPAIGAVLLLRGLAGVAGVAAGAALGARPVTALVIPLVLQAVALVILDAFGGSALNAVVPITVTGFAFSMLATAASARVMQIAPGAISLATATASTAVNVGITLGAFVGSVALPMTGTRDLALVGAGFTVPALAVLVAVPQTSRPANERREIGSDGMRRDHSFDQTVA